MTAVAAVPGSGRSRILPLVHSLQSFSMCACRHRGAVQPRRHHALQQLHGRCRNGMLGCVDRGAAVDVTAIWVLRSVTKCCCRRLCLSRTVRRLPWPGCVSGVPARPVRRCVWYDGVHQLRQRTVRERDWAASVHALPCWHQLLQHGCN